MDDTEARLRALFAHADPVPPRLDEAARAAFAWRTVDAELAELLEDAALVRGRDGPRQLSFEAPSLGIELEVVETGPRARRVTGQLLPAEPASVRVERPDASPLEVAADELGRFELELPAGVVRLLVGRVATAWVTV